MRGYHIDLTCARCGADVEEVTAGRVVANETSAVCRCTECRVEWHVHVRLLPVAPRPFRFDEERASPAQTLCGTPAGYGRHLRASEDACEACKAAHAAAVAEQTARKHQGREGAPGRPFSEREGWEVAVARRRREREEALEMLADA